MTQTPRGFSVIEFKDSYGVYCSLQESSATAPKIWLGVDRDCGRMHLTQEQVRELLPHLQKFADTGEL